MHVINPEQLRLEPGQSLQAGFAPSSGDQDEIGFFLRSGSTTVPGNGDIGIVQRAGLIRFDDVLLVVTLIKVHWPREEEEIFDVWWDYHSGVGFEQFGRMAEQEKLTFHFYSESGKAFSLDRNNEFKRFFGSLKKHFQTAPAWTEVDFDRAVRGFCSQAYPKEHLWDMIEFKPEPESPVDDEVKKQDDLVSSIPENLRSFYLYVPEKGHCINVIPSAFERDAEAGNPDEYIHPAPVKTVLRCGIRWIKGYPVAPIPFIPGHGLAVPPDDMEF